MANPLDNFEIEEISQGELEPGMVLAESFMLQPNGSSRRTLALGIGRELTPDNVERLNNLEEHPEIVREEGVQTEAPIKIFRLLDERKKDWIEALRNDYIVRERLIEGVVKKYREEGLTAIHAVSDITKPLVQEVLRSQKDIHDTIFQKSKHHSALEDLLKSPEFRSQIENGILEPLSQKPILSSYLTFAPHAAEHSLDVTTLTVRVGFELGLSEETIYDLALASMMHDIGMDYFRSMGREPTRDLVPFHSIYLVEKILTTGEERKPIDELKKEHIQIMKHHHSRRDGSGYKEPARRRGDKQTTYIGKSLSPEDTPELFRKIADLTEDAPRPNHPKVATCPTDYNEILYLAERWVTGVNLKERNTLESARLLKSIHEDSGLCARTSYVEAFRKVVDASYFSRSLQ